MRDAGHESLLYVGGGKRFPFGQGIRPLYPRPLSRLSHTRFAPFVDRFFPKRPWIDEAFRKIADDNSDLVHIHNFHGDYASVASLAYLAKRKKVVWTMHGFWGITGGCDHPKQCTRYQMTCGECPHLGEWPLGLIDTTAEQLSEKLRYLSEARLWIVAPSKFVADKVKGSSIGAEWDVSYIPNGINAQTRGFKRKRNRLFRQSLGIRDDATVVLVVNRDFKDRQKGFDQILGTLRRVASDDLQIVLVGLNSGWARGQLPPELTCVAFDYIEEPSELSRIYEAADIFLFASPAETFSCVTLEAKAASCCVVSTPTSGVVEQIENHRTGILARDLSPDALIDALQYALSVPAVAKELGINSRIDVETHYSETQMIQAHLEIYEKVISS